MTDSGALQNEDARYASKIDSKKLEHGCRMNFGVIGRPCSNLVLLCRLDQTSFALQVACLSLDIKNGNAPEALLQANLEEVGPVPGKSHDETQKEVVPSNALRPVFAFWFQW